MHINQEDLLPQIAIDFYLNLIIIFLQLKDMIEEIWKKKIVTIVEMNQEDVCDELAPLPLIIEIAWNSYIGFHYDLIIDFFQIYAPFPHVRQQFHLTTSEGQHIIEPNIIAYHLYERFGYSHSQPIQLRCNFRRKEANPQMDLRRVYKNNLKTSTALKYGKYGASILTVQMSINNVQNMINNFRNGNYERFMGPEDLQSDQLGYRFLIHRAEKLAVKIMFDESQIERSSNKQNSLQEFLINNIGVDFKQYQYRVHLVPLKDLSIKMGQLEKYCHPDGYLYIHI